jgi:hypothetical protein
VNIRLQTGWHSILRLAGLGFLSTVIGWAQLPVGSISGQLQTESGQPVAGALVTAAPAKAPADGSMGQSVQTVSASDGTFSLNQVPGNVYWMCANLAGSKLVDPCSWSPSPPTADISGGGSQTGVVLTLKQGVFVHFRVSDSSHALQGGKAGGPITAPFLIQVWGPRGMQPAQRIIDDDQGHTFRILAPFAAPLHFQMNPGQLKLLDQTGAQLTGSALQQQFTVNKGDPPLVFQFSVQAP